MLETALNAVLADPWSDAARAAFARAVEPRDPARAELVTVQLRLALARRRGARGAREWRRDYARAQALLGAHEARWRPALSLADATLRFGRGFAEMIACTPAQLERHADAIRAAMPLLDLVLRGATAQDLGTPRFSGLRSLDLRRNQLDDAAAAALAASPHLGELRWLDLSGNRVGQAGLEALAASPNLPALQWLGFARNAAPDPTPQVAEEQGVVHFVELPQEGARLQAAHGPRAWLARPYPELADPDPETYHR